MLYLIGLGLSWKDLSLKSLEAINGCEEVYLESFTSIADFSPEKLSKLIGKKITILNRKQTEEELPFLKDAHVKNVALLIYGDPLTATTHFEILQMAKKKKIETKVIHGPSIFTAIAETGLSLYRFGKTASIPIPEANYKPESFFDVLVENQKIDAHTLFLLEMKIEDKKNLTILQAIEILLEINKKRKSNLFTGETFVVGCARLGFENSLVKAGKASEIREEDFGQAPYVLIVPAKLNHKEQEYTETFK